MKPTNSATGSPPQTHTSMPRSPSAAKRGASRPATAGAKVIMVAAAPATQDACEPIGCSSTWSEGEVSMLASTHARDAKQYALSCDALPGGKKVFCRWDASLT